jgi:hypothetical protein
LLSGNFGDFKDFSMKTAEISCHPVSEKFQKLIRRVEEAGRAAGVPPGCGTQAMAKWPVDGLEDTMELPTQ